MPIFVKTTLLRPEIDTASAEFVALQISPIWILAIGTLQIGKGSDTENKADFSSISAIGILKPPTRLPKNKHF